LLVKNTIALVVSVLAVHLAYLGYIRPEAALLIEQAVGVGEASPRVLVVILKDWEQQICLTLMLWGCYLILSKCRLIVRDRYLFKVDLLERDVEDSEGLEVALESIESLPEELRETPLVRTLLSSLKRYLITKDVQNTSDTIDSSIEALAVKLEAENAMIRYLIWAIPSLGFIGTVRGIGEALSQANEALAGNIAGMTDSLGVAFNSTLVALLISILLMFLLNQLQRLQDSLVVDTQEYCQNFLLNRISGYQKN